MKIYGISGLGADERVFKYLTLEYELIPIKWIEPNENEIIENYSIRLTEQINTNERFGLIGVSFGGLIAVELNKIIKPEFTILISSVGHKTELRKIYRIIGRLGVLKLIPARFFKIPGPIAKLLFGAQNFTLLYQILDDTDLNFVKWSLNQLTKWKNTVQIKNCIKICGDKDRLLPPKNKNLILIKGGHHFMIVDKASEISEIINEKIKERLNSSIF